jgi:hypothetical protein
MTIDGAGEKLWTSRCACGWSVTGSTDLVIAATIEHGERIHNMAATAEQVMARAVPADITET